MAEKRSSLKKRFRLVLVGWATSGKSASGNTILGKNEFLSGRRTSRRVSGHAQVAGREVTVVDTPGWTDVSMHDTPESIQEEIISSGIPAPDAVLLLIPLHIEITEDYIRSVTDHLRLLGDTVWSRTIVLFSFGNWLRNQTTIERHIERNSALQTLIRLCENNYHVLENAKGTDGKQVEDLMLKIENMSVDNNLSEDPGDVQHVSEETQAENAVAQDTNVDCEQHEKPRSGGMQCFPELRLMLLGFHRSGKSSTGNTILGSSKFGEWTVKKYQKEEAEVAGRRLVVVDTPPWQKATGMSPDQNIVNWVCQCPPGPHAFIFVLNLSTQFTEGQWELVQRYMELLGKRAWKHAIIIFTGADIMEGINVKSYLRNKSTSLQKLLEKCGNRHYFFNNRNRGHSTQVTDLLEGIEQLSSEHSPGFYEMDKTIAASMEKMNQVVSEKAQKRRQKVAAKEDAKRVIFHEGKAHKLTEVRIVLLGEKWSGKTTVAKTMAPWFFREDKTKCVATTTRVSDRIVLIVDTPGWSTHTWIRKTQKQGTITEALSLCHPGPHALLIVVSLKSNFTENQREALEQNLACLPDTMWKNTMVLFTSGEELQGETIEEHIENEGEALQWLVEKCDNRYHVFSNTPFNDFPQVKELLGKIDEMVEGNSGQYVHNIIAQIHSETSGSRNDPIDTEEDDFEYTLRERQMMEKMKKEIRELLQMDIKSYVCAQLKVESKQGTHPNMSLGQPASEDGIRKGQKGTKHHEGDSAFSSDLNVNIDDISPLVEI